MVGIVGSAFSIIAVCARWPLSAVGQQRCSERLVDCARRVGKPTSASPCLK